MRIGQYVHFGIGGADKAAYNLILGLKSIGADVQVFYNEFSIPRPTKIYDQNVKILSRFDAYKDIGLTKINSVKEFNNYNLDILGTHRPGDDKWALPGFEQSNFNFKIVETNFHGELETKANYRIFPSKALVDFKNIRSHHSVIPNPIMPPANTNNLREKLNLKDKFIYGRIARPTNELYCDINLRAYQTIQDDTTVMLYVAPCNKAREAASSLKIKNIIFIESTINEAEISDIYNTMDVLCHGTKVGETFGNTIAEAMMHGKPVVSHRGFNNWTQAQPEVLGELAPILYIDSHDVIKYANIMKRLKDDKLFYNDVSNKSIKRANAIFDYRIVARKYLDVYQRVHNGNL